MNHNFLCPQCKQYNLQIIKSHEIELDPQDDKKSIQIVGCNCNFTAIAIYEESARGADTVYNHFGYFVPVEKITQLKNCLATQQIPNEKNYIINPETGYIYDRFKMQLM